MSRPDSPNKTSESGPKGLETMTRALVDADNYHRWLFGEIEPFLGLKALRSEGVVATLLDYCYRKLTLP